MGFSDLDYSRVYRRMWYDLQASIAYGQRFAKLGQNWRNWLMHAFAYAFAKILTPSSALSFGPIGSKFGTEVGAWKISGNF